MLNFIKIFSFLLFIVVGCDSLKSENKVSPRLDKEEILQKVKSLLGPSSIPDDTLVSITVIKDSPIEGLKEGAILFKNLKGTQPVPFYISNDGRYIIFNSTTYDLSSPKKDLDLMGKIDFKGVPVSNSSSTDSIRIVEYSDYQCPACKFAALEVIAKLKNDYGEKVSFYFKHFPLTFHKWSNSAATFTACLNDVHGAKTFWEVHDLIFKFQKDIKVASFESDLLEIIKTSNLNLESSSCWNNHTNSKYVEFVNSNLKEGKELGVESTPTFIIEGYIVRGADLGRIKEAIDNFLR